MIVGIFLSGCDYDNPGDEGTKPTPPPDQSVTYISKALPVTGALECTIVYRVNVSVSQTAPCEGYNFTELYHRAKSLVDARTAQLTCPTGTDCPNKHTAYTLWRWGCQNGVATAKVKASVVCLGTSAPAPANLGDGSTLDKTKPVVQKAPGEPGGGFTGTDDGEAIVDVCGTTTNAWAPNCDPKKTLVLVTYREKDALQMPPENHQQSYQGYVNRAQAKAQMIYGLFSCPSGCSVKSPFRAVYTKWSFDNNTKEVVVEIYFEVECKKP